MIKEVYEKSIHANGRTETKAIRGCTKLRNLKNARHSFMINYVYLFAYNYHYDIPVIVIIN